MKPIIHTTLAIAALTTMARSAITYVDATVSNTTQTVTGTNSFGVRATNAANFVNTDLFQALQGTGAGKVDNDDTLIQTVNVADGVYDVYAYYGTDPDGTGTLWGIRASLDNSTYTLFNNTNGSLESDGVTFDRRSGYVGQVTVTDGTLELYNRIPIGPVSTRFYYDGLGYELVPEPTAALLGGLGTLVLLRRRR